MSRSYEVTLSSGANIRISESEYLKLKTALAFKSQGLLLRHRRQGWVGQSCPPWVDRTYLGSAHMIDVATQRELWKHIRAYAKATGEAMVASPTTSQPGWKAKGREFDKANAELASFIQSITITEKRT